jgi:hypothetical protein
MLLKNVLTLKYAKSNIRGLALLFDAGSGRGEEGGMRRDSGTDNLGQTSFAQIAPVAETSTAVL